MTVPNSLVVIFPSPSLSKRLKASLNSAICSSVRLSTIVLNQNAPCPLVYFRSNNAHFKHKQTGEALWHGVKWTPASVPSNFADIHHKQTGERLCVENKYTPIWVKAAIAPLKLDVQEERWQDLFSNPTLWWDHRARKGNPRAPDFIHKQSGEGLWLGGKRTPVWVASKVACFGPGTLQVDIVSAVERLARYNKAGCFVQTLELYERMQRNGVNADHYIFLHVLHACAAIGFLEEGRRIHLQIIETGWKFHPYIGSSLVDMYAKCGSIEDAQAVFDKMPVRDVPSWNAMMIGKVKCGQAKEALELFHDMQRDGSVPNSRTFVALLNACASMTKLEEGRLAHKQIIRSGCESVVYVGNSLVDMYAKCGSMEDAQAVFDKMPKRDVVAWTAMILGYVKCGQRREALEMCENMQRDGVLLDARTCVALVNACANMAALEEGRRVHKQILRSGYESDVYVGNSLVDMYAKCGSIADAQAVFDKMLTRDVVAWTAMILGYVKCGLGEKALQLFRNMQRDGIVPNSFTFVAVLNACASMATLEEGRSVHKQVVRSGCESDVHVANSLVDMYAKCGSIEDAQIVFSKMPFRDVITWTAMITGHVECGQGLQALGLLQDMQRDGIVPNSFTFVALLNACASISALEAGRRLHTQIVKSGCESDAYVANSLVDMYVKCGNMEDARGVFDNMPTRNVVSWNAMIMGFALHGLGKVAVSYFEQMSRSGCEMNEVTFIHLLTACGHEGLVKEGLKYFRGMQSNYGVTPIQEHYTCLVDILGRAGHIDEAEAAIKGMPLEPSATVWRSLLGSCRVHGNLDIGERTASASFERRS